MLGAAFECPGFGENRAPECVFWEVMASHKILDELLGAGVAVKQTVEQGLATGRLGDGRIF